MALCLTSIILSFSRCEEEGYGKKKKLGVTRAMYRELDESLEIIKLNHIFMQMRKWEFREVRQLG